jgi:two-component sensor histidine kinase
MKSSDERDDLLREFDHRMRNELSTLMAIIRYHLDNPPPSATAVLSRLAGQILAISATYDMSRGAREGGGDAADFCASFIADIERDLCPLCRIGFDAQGAKAELPTEAARTLGVALGEMLLDAAERSSRKGAIPEIKVALVYEGDRRFTVRVRDSSPPEEGPLMADALARALRGELRTMGGSDYTERELTFSSAGSDGACRDAQEDRNRR